MPPAALARTSNDLPALNLPSDPRGSLTRFPAGPASVCPQDRIWQPGVDFDIAISSSVMSTGTSANSGVLR